MQRLSRCLSDDNDDDYNYYYHDNDNDNDDDDDDDQTTTSGTPATTGNALNIHNTNTALF